MITLVAIVSGQTQAPWDGQWVTDFGLLEFSQSGDQVEGQFPNGRINGTAADGRLKFTYHNDQSRGEGSFILAPDKLSFHGQWSTQGQNGSWRGWTIDPLAEQAPRADFSGLWVSSLGNMVLEQDADRVRGTYGSQGWSTIEGVVQGRRLQLTWRRLQWSGKAWLEMTPDGQRVFGMTAEAQPTKWLGVRLKGYTPNVAASAGKVVNGRASNAMCYHLRAPDGYTAGQPVDAIVLLHGMNWTTRGMVPVTARNWPELGSKYMIIGIQGENWAEWSDADDLRHNYSYINWMGKSTFNGYPYTDRESPALIAEVIDELSKRHKLQRVFLGGHSQGGYLAFIMYMHFPEMFAGVFPMSSGVVMQAEPSAFDRPELRDAQRNTPLAIVHGRKDPNVDITNAEYGRSRFLASRFPMVRLFDPDLKHGYDFLPVGQAMRWLEGMSAHTISQLAAQARRAVAEQRWRDVAALVARAAALGGADAVAESTKALDAAARVQLDHFSAVVQNNNDGSWIEPFLQWYERFEFAPAGQHVVGTFRTMREDHDVVAERLIDEAQSAFQAGSPDEAYAKYEVIVNQYYAAGMYPIVKQWLAQRQ
jgi:predicted esterase